jgi:chloramphenicol 3-O-phosphotransferase
MTEDRGQRTVFKNVLIGLDQTLNCLFRLDGEWGQPDETLSARAWRVRDAHPGWARWIDRIFFWKPGHCRASYESEQQRRHLPASYIREIWERR